MLLVGAADYPSPISESEQFYQALQIRGLDSVLVRFPGGFHNISERPSQLAAKVAYVQAWFQRHDVRQDP